MGRLKERIREKSMFLPSRYIGCSRKLKPKQENPFLIFVLGTNTKQTCTGVIRCFSTDGRQGSHISKKREKYMSKRHRYVATFGGREFRRMRRINLWYELETDIYI